LTIAERFKAFVKTTTLFKQKLGFRLEFHGQNEASKSCCIWVFSDSLFDASQSVSINSHIVINESYDLAGCFLECHIASNIQARLAL